eukprot:scaffold24330_cov20-Tisochrysis_lutea.AAC.1
MPQHVVAGQALGRDARPALCVSPHALWRAPHEGLKPPHGHSCAPPPTAWTTSAATAAAAAKDGKARGGRKQEGH